MIKVEPEVYAFNERGKPEAIIEYDAYQLLLKVKNGTATQDDKDRIFNELQQSSIYGHGKRVALLGNFIDFSQWLKCFWVKYKYIGIVEVFAFSKMNIRRNDPMRSWIIKIVEID